MSTLPPATAQPRPQTPAARPATQTPTRAARQRAAVILEVLAGARTPAQAAAALELSLPRYYQLETVALQGLLAACEPVPRGRVRSAESQLAALRKQQQRLERELARQQALVRLTQRTVGLAAPPTPPAHSKGEAGKGRKPRRAVARALRVAERLRQPEPTVTPPAAIAQEGQH